jgi:AsmA family protein
MKRVVGLAAALLSVLLLGAAAVVAILTWVSLDLDLTPYKARVLEEVRARTGLQLDVSGPLALRIGPDLGLRVEGLRLASPAAGKTPLLEAQRATLTVATLPLLRGQVEPRELDLTGARLNLTRDADRPATWNLPGPGPVTWLEGLRLRVRSSRIDYSDGSTGRSFRMGVRALEARRDGEVLNLALDGDLDGEPVRLTGRTAPLARILAATGPLPLALRGQFLGLDVQADGTLPVPDTKTATRATLSLKAKDLQGLRPWLGPDAAALGPLDARFVLDGRDRSFTLNPLALSVGPTRADGQAKIDLRGKRPTIDIDLTLAELDLRPYLSEEGQGGAGPGQGRVFSDAPLALGWMEDADVQARVQVSHLSGGRQTVTDLDLTATLAEGRLKVAGTGKADGGRVLTLDLGLDSGGPAPRLDLDLRGDKLMIAPMLAGSAAEDRIRGDLDARVKLHAAGASPAAMAGALTGNLMVQVQGAEARLQDLDRLTGWGKAILGQIVTPKSSMARVDCGLVALSFDRGRTAIKGVVDTPNSVVTGEGSLDLARETIELRLVPQAKGVNLSVAAPVVVTGPLASPNYRIEPTGLVVSLSELAARIAVPQLLLVDAFGQAVAGSPCGQILAGQIPSGREYDLLGGAGDAAGAVLQGPAGLAKGVGGVVEETGGLVKDAGDAVIEGAGELFKGVGGLLKGAGEAVKGAVQPGPDSASKPAPQP